jgi:tellurite resistance protein TehA-like permease
MTMTPTPVPAPAPAPRRIELPSRAHLFEHVAPNWFASVMGTGIVGVCAAGLPLRVPGLSVVAVAFWLLAAGLLLLLTLATVVHWRLFPDIARGYLHHRVLAHFYGTIPMAALTVGAATLLVGRDVIGAGAAVDLDWILWTPATIAGLITLAVIPYVAIRHHGSRPGDAFGGWLLPIVPPTVSASTGALLVPHAAPALRQPLVVACYVVLGLSLLACLPIAAMVMRTRLRGPAVLVPSLWNLLGPLGQSTAAVNLLAADAASAGLSQAGLHECAVGYGVTAWLAAMLWLVWVARRTREQARDELPFSLAWWSFTFPLGTCVLGATALDRHTGIAGFGIAAVVLFAGLVIAWAVVASRTVRGVRNRTLLLPG